MYNSMDIVGKNLSKMATLRNLTMLSTHISTPRFCTVASVQKVEEPIPRLSRNLEQDNLLDMLQQPQSPSKLVDFIESNKATATPRHTVAALTSLHQYYETQCFFPENLQKEPNFVKLCTLLKVQLRKLELVDTIQALKILNLLKTPSSTIIIQSLLQLVRMSINDLSLSDIYFLTFLLKRLDQSPLRDSISLALPTVFTTQLKTQIDTSSLQELKNALRYASTYAPEQASITFIVDSLRVSSKKLTLKDANSILWSLCSIEKLPNGYQDVLYRVEGVITNNVKHLNWTDIVTSLSRLVVKIQEGHEEFYHPIMIDGFAQIAVNNKFSFDEGNTILRYMVAIKHINTELLDYLSNKCHQEPNTLTTCKPNSILALVSGLSMANYTPAVWPEIQIPFTEIALSKYNSTTLCHFAVHLATLNCFNTKILEKVFSSQYTLTPGKVLLHQMLLRLYQSVKTLHPTYSGPWPAKEVINNFKLLTKKKEHPLKFALSKVIKESQYIKTNMKTKLEHQIDYAIVTRNDNTITETDTNSNAESEENFTYLEDITDQSQVILVLYGENDKYARNTTRMLGPEYLFVRSLEAMNHTVVPICATTWCKLSESERLPYLSRAIETKCEDTKK